MTLASSFKKTLSIVGIFWVIKLFETFTTISFSYYGIYPRTQDGLIGILASPFLHGDLNHLISNSIPFLVLGTSLLFFYQRIAKYVIFLIYIFTGVGVWMFARGSYHIGASGVVYGFASFLFFCGVFRKDFKSITITLIVAFLYGGLIYGVLPTQLPVSWESHLIGAVVGAVCAYLFRKIPENTDKDAAKSPDFRYEQEGYRNMESDKFKYQYKGN